MSHKTTDTLGLIAVDVRDCTAEAKSTIGTSAVAIKQKYKRSIMSTVIAGELSFANELPHGAFVVLP
jgi:hypothetical protein